MAERRADQVTDFVRPFPHGHLDHRRCHHRTVGHHDALGLAGGAAGIGDPGKRFRRMRRERPAGAPGNPEASCSSDGPTPACPMAIRCFRRGARRLQFGGDGFEMIRIIHQQIDLGVLDDIEIVLDSAHRMQRGGDDIGERQPVHHRRNLHPVLRDHRRAQRLGRQRSEGLRKAADRIAQFPSALRRAVRQHHHHPVQIVRQRVRNQIGGEDGLV